MGNPIGNIQIPPEQYQQALLESYIEKFENFYEENNVYKTLFICESDEEVYDILAHLEDNNHSVCPLFYDDLYDDRENFYVKLHNFKGDTHRIFLLSYRTWFTLKSELKVFLLPHQNLITLGTIGENGSRVIQDWLYEACIGGFLETSPRILKLYDTNNYE